jgi:hypothetical protein
VCGPCPTLGSFYGDSHRGANATLDLGNGMTRTMPITTWAQRASFVREVESLGLDALMAARLANPNAKQLAWPLMLPDGRPSHNVTDWLHELDKEVDLFMVTESYNESLLLLGNCLGLQAEELVPPTSGEVRHSMNSHNLPLSNEDRAAIYGLSGLDLALHNHARTKMQQLLSAPPNVFEGARAALMAPRDATPDAVAAAATAASRTTKSALMNSMPSCTEQALLIHEKMAFWLNETDATHLMAQFGLDPGDPWESTPQDGTMIAATPTSPSRTIRAPFWKGARVICVSQGTTGTHAVFDAVARMGARVLDPHAQTLLYSCPNTAVLCHSDDPATHP